MRARLLLALAAATTVALSGPFVGEINSALQRAFPGQHLRIIVAIVLLPALVGGVVAVARIRQDRLLRYGALMSALLLAGLYVAVMQPLYTEQFHLTEYGLLTFLFYRVWHSRGDLTSLVLPVAATFIAGMADEWFQWFIPSRVGELRDVLLNSVGITCGLLFAVGLNPPTGASWPREARSMRALGAGACVLIVCTAIFLQCVHMGFEIADPRIGTFHSRYSAEELRELAVDRASRWRAGAPAAPLLSREDHYLSEARYHIQKRNELLGDGDPVSAWGENHLLEAYYQPALDLGIPGSRWPPEQRADVESRAAGDRGAFVSEAYPLPIYTWSRTVFWTVVLVLAGAVAVWTFSRRSTLSTAAPV